MYVEETAPFVRSGEEQDQPRYEDDRRSAGEDRGGEEDGEGDQSLHKSTFPFFGLCFEKKWWPGER